MGSKIRSKTGALTKGLFCCVVALVILCSRDLWSFGSKWICFSHVWTFWNLFESFVKRMNAFDPKWIAFRNFKKSRIQFAICTKTTSWFLWPYTRFETAVPTLLVGSSPSDRNRECVSERARLCFSEKSLWENLATIGIVLVCRARLSGAKFFAW